MLKVRAELKRRGALDGNGWEESFVVASLGIAGNLQLETCEKLSKLEH